ncbi:uncharacterized protein LOC128673756 isoform X3 [Plodia interpunctella]|uniref:uncharacterized protein LOC128673756 isoform X3 n=1 Tax=Plodia interpunctella TaxID=58824 RepID=UPI00236897CE|nr:uncharacterized protein LOC128673756 isoform X3 [Plodia interpunctella]
MKAEAGECSFAVLVVLAACWPAAAEFNLRQILCDSLDCDSPEYETPDKISKEEVLKNITDLLGLNFLDIAHGDDPFNNLLDICGKLELDNYAYPNLTNYRRMPFLFVYEASPMNLNNRPQYQHAKPFPPKNMTYVPSQPQFRFLYTAAPSFMEFMVPHQRPEFVQHVVDESFSVTQFKLQLLPQGIGHLLTLLSGPITFVLALLTTALLLIVGWKAALRRTLKRTRHRRHFDRKCECNRKCCLAIILMTLLTLYIFCLWGFYMAEQQMEDGMRNIALVFCNYSRTLGWTLHNASILPIWLRAKPWEKLPEGPMKPGEFTSFTKHWLHYNNHLITDLSLRRSDVKALMNITSQLDIVQRNLIQLKNDGAMLWYLADQLNTELRKLKQTLLESLAGCAAPVCVELQWKNHIMEFNTDTPHVQIPDLTKALDMVTQLRDQGLHTEVADALRSYHYVDVKLNEYQTHIFGHYGDMLHKAWKMGHVYLRRYWYTIQKLFLIIDEIDAYRMRFLNVYLPLISSIFFWISCFLLIPLALLLGFPHGFLGYRPRMNNKLFTLISRGTGARCMYMNPTRSILMTAIVDPFVDIEKLQFRDEANHSSNYRLSTVLDQLMYPESNNRRHYYWVFHLDRFAREDRHKFIFFKNLLRSLDEMQSKAPTHVLPSRVSVLSDRAKQNLRQFANTRFSDLALDRIPEALMQSKLQFSKTSREMALLSDALKRAADSVPASGSYGTISSDIRTAAAALQDLRLNIVLPMFEYTHKINSSINRVQESLRFNVSHTSPEQAIKDYLGEVEEGERFINEDLDKKARLALRQLSRDVTGMVLAVYRSHITRTLPPGDFSVPYIADMKRMLCVNILLSVHGMWFCLFLCCLMLLAMILAARTLARSWLHTQSYPGPTAVYAYDEAKWTARQWCRLRRQGCKDDKCADTCRDPSMPKCLPSVLRKSR